MTEDPAFKSNPHRTWLERLSHFLLREPKDREQLLELLRDAEQRHLLDQHALGMIEGVLQVSDMQVRDIMIPRAEIVFVHHDTMPSEFLPIIIESGHSRFPVFDGNQEVIGILLAKDMLRYNFNAEQNQFVMANAIRPALFVPESIRLDRLLQEFRIKRHHMAIVVDEYGGVAGLVTIEDVLEQIVGEIEDEYDDSEDDATIKKYSPTRYIVKANTSIIEFNDYFKDSLPTSSEIATIDDFVMHAFGYLPKRGETIQIGKYLFKVLHADGRHIRLLRVVLQKKLREQVLHA